MITHVGVGAAANQNYQTAGSPAIPAGALAGDLLFCLSVARSTADNVLSSSWPTISIVDTPGFFVLASYKIAAGGDAAPTITPVGMSSGNSHVSRVSAWRGVDPISPFLSVSTAVQVGSSQDVTNIAPPASLPDDGAIIVVGSRLGTWTSAATLSGDGLSWAEAWDEATAVTNTLSWVMDYAIWSGGVPPLTSKTFTITGGTASSNIGQMWALNAMQPPVSGARRRLLSSMTFPPFP